MNTKTRLALLFGLLLLAFGATVLSLRVWYAREADRMLVNLQHERRALLEQVLQLTSQSLRNFATDYSNWDEMLAFVHSGDPAWATINIDASLQTFNVQAAWVLRTDGSLVYGATRQLSEVHPTPPFPLEPVLAKMRVEKFAHFFVAVPAGLLEIRTAPIQPSSDVRRDSEAQGWLLIGQLWNSAYLKTLTSVLDSELSLLAPDGAPDPSSSKPGIHLRQNLTGWDGHIVQVMQLDYHPESLLAPLENDQLEMVLFCCFGCAAIIFIFAGVSRWVIKPLRQLELSMATQSSVPLAGLSKQTDEFGRLAQLVTSSFNRRATLELTVDYHKKTEIALRQSEEQVRLSAALRARLARDLHDHVIQSIYATGLGLESIRRTLSTDPLVAEQHLEAVRQTLNQLIREIRSFITGLEPEATQPTPNFAQALQTLATTLQSLHPIHIELNLDPQVAVRLSPQEEVHALQIVREGVSNALRHGNATQIDLRLLDVAGVSLLQIEDNGCGFDLATVTGRGSGLSNLTARAQEMGATLRIDSAPGDGTRLNLRFHQAPLT